MSKINVKETEITIISIEENDYISLTDMANAKESKSRAADIIKNWLRSRYTLEFLGTWEQINNPNFKVVEFDHFKTQAGLPCFVFPGCHGRYNVNNRNRKTILANKGTALRLAQRPPVVN